MLFWFSCESNQILIFLVNLCFWDFIVFLIKHVFKFSKNMIKNQFIPEKKFYYEFIDGLRGLAVLMVLLVHTSQRVGNEFTGSFHYKIIEIIVNFGARGVQLFFILSAFTLYNSSKLRFNSDKYPKMDFYLRRIFRIFPFWIIMVFIMAVITDNSLNIHKIFLNITFLFGFIRFIPDIELVPTAWTLFVEETFYLTLPFLLYYIKNFFQAFKFFILALVLAILWLYAAPLFGIPSTNAFISLFPFSNWFVFAIGICLYFLFSNPKFINIFEIPGFIFFLDSITIISIAMALLVSSISFTYIFASFSLAILFLASISRKSFFGKLTRNKLLMRFGVYCYSIYLFHMPLLTLLQPLQKLIFYKLNIVDSIVEIKLIVYFPLVALICLIISFFSFNLIEKPCINLGKLFISKANYYLSKN